MFTATLPSLKWPSLAWPTTSQSSNLAKLSTWTEGIWDQLEITPLFLELSCTRISLPLWQGWLRSPFILPSFWTGHSMWTPSQHLGLWLSLRWQLSIGTTGTESAIPSTLSITRQIICATTCAHSIISKTLTSASVNLAITLALIALIIL